MFKRKLLALDFHSPDTFNAADVGQFRSMIVWLEDQKIRHYKIEDRQNLRNITSPNWPEALQQYLKDLTCPYSSLENQAVIDWLLGYAVRLEYGDNVDKYKNETAEKMQQNQSSAPKIVSTNPLDNLDFESEEFKQGVEKLAQLLNVTKHPDHLVTLRAVSRLIQDKFSAEVLQNPNDFIVEGRAFPLQEADLGFDTGDYVLNQAAKVLRLLYIRDVRDLQTKINECIVAVQTITANPKTDTRLGKVGR
jgi:RLL motif-containing protein 1